MVGSPLAHEVETLVIVGEDILFRKLFQLQGTSKQRQTLGKMRGEGEAWGVGINCFGQIAWPENVGILALS